MGKELSMARSEGRNRTRQAQLLGSSRTGVSSLTSSRRNKRKEATPTTKEAKGSSTENTSAESKIRAEVEATDGVSRPERISSKRGGPGLHDKDRKPDRGAEGADRIPRRNASELGIEWIGSFCPDGQPHYLVGSHSFDGGSLLICKHCKKHVWLPIVMNEAAALDRMIDHLGATKGYCKFLDKNQPAKVMMAKLQDLWYARQRISDNDELMKLVVAIMGDKEYDRKEVQWKNLE